MSKSKNRVERGEVISTLYTTKGQPILVSTCDLPKILEVTWSIHKSGYVYGRYNNMQVDHINKNKLDNTRPNLRIVTRLENLQNKSTYKNNKCSTQGVSFIPRLNKWRARIYINGKEIHIGMFKSRDEAISKRNEYAKEHYGGYVECTK